MTDATDLWHPDAKMEIMKPPSDTEDAASDDLASQDVVFAEGMSIPRRS